MLESRRLFLAAFLTAALGLGTAPLSALAGDDDDDDDWDERDDRDDDDHDDDDDDDDRRRRSGVGRRACTLQKLCDQQVSRSRSLLRRMLAA